MPPKGVYSPKLDLEGITGTSSVEIPTTGSIKREDLITEVEPHTDMTRINDKAAELAFMEEPVEIYLQEGSSQNEEPVVYVGVNGEGKWLRRGQQHTLKRKFVLNLLTARPTHYTTVEGMDRDGARTINLRSQTAFKYPFSVVNDTPKGMAWHKSLQGAR